MPVVFSAGENSFIVCSYGVIQVFSAPKAPVACPNKLGAADVVVVVDPGFPRKAVP